MLDISIFHSSARVNESKFLQLQQLHQLPVCFLVQIKVLVMVYNAL